MRFKKLFSVILFVFCLQTGNTQTYFNNRYEVFGSWDVAHSILATDSNYFVSSVVTDSNNFYRVCIQSIDLNGNLLFEKKIGKPNWYFNDGYAGSLILSSDTNLVFAGGVYDAGTIYLASLVKYNLQGDTVWTKTFGDSISGYLGYQCKQTSDGGYIIVGAMDNGSSTQALLIKTDSLGNKLWEQNYGGAGIEYGFSVCVMPDKGFLIAGQTTSYGNGSSNQYLLKTDSLGNQQWFKFYGTFYDEYATNIIATSDGKYVYSGFRGSATTGYTWPTLTKVDSLGNIVWDKTYGPLRNGTVLYSLKESSDGEIIAVGTVEYQGTRRDGLVVKADSLGNQIWYRHPYLLSGFTVSVNLLYGMDITSDGGIIACGFVNASLPDTGSQDIWVIKLDEWGCDTLGCQTVGLDEPEEEKVEVKVYPNPTSGNFTIAYSLSENSRQNEFLLYDITGRLITQFILPTNKGSITQNLNAIPSGIYYYSILNETTLLASGKLVVVR